ncbi:hypothetical protein JKP88DRAFT_348756 [Tribonema minus]|uniref:Uncharacterized protein n=1 Tax=Tribonema minus TaxID=303371 RepID=A0A836CEK9_9STRA|nr:hypothetical protein JKP88DRAFT_348756 [Tribonema minus]
MAAILGDDDSSRFHEEQLLDELVPANVNRIYSSKLFRVQVVAPAKCVKARVSTTVTVAPPDIDIGTVVLGVNGERYAICEAHPGRIFRTANGSDLAWEEVPGCKTDISAGIATAEVRRFSSYAYGINLEEHKGMRALLQGNYTPAPRVQESARRSATPSTGNAAAPSSAVIDNWYAVAAPDGDVSAYCRIAQAQVRQLLAPSSSAGPPRSI